MSRFDSQIAAAVADGTIPSPKSLLCLSCGEPASSYHHAAYGPGMALKVVPVCGSCHGRIHGSKIADPSNGLYWCRVCEASVACSHQRGISHTDAHRLRDGQPARGPRADTIRVPVDAREKREIVKRAKAAGRTVADFIRRRVLGEDVAPDGRVARE